MILLWALLALGTVCAVEGFIRLPVAQRARDLQALLNKIGRTLSSDRISDHWKEKVLPRYAGQLLMLSVVLFLYICLAISPILLIGLVAGALEVPFLGFVATPAGITGSTGLAAVYAYIRVRLS